MNRIPLNTIQFIYINDFFKRVCGERLQQQDWKNRPIYLFKKKYFHLTSGSRSNSAQHDSILIFDVFYPYLQKSRSDPKNFNLIPYKGPNDSDLEFLGDFEKYRSRDMRKDFSIDSSSISIREESLFNKDFLKVLNSPKSVIYSSYLERKKFHEQVNRQQEGK